MCDSERQGTVPAIARHLFDTPGDFQPRPHGNCYWLVPGSVLAGEHPAQGDRTYRVGRIDALLDSGARRFVDLTEEDEHPEAYTRILYERARARGLPVTHRRFAIRDFGVPSAEVMRATLDSIYEAIVASRMVYLHCRGGIGRTGTVVGCLLREQGLTASEAFAVVARKWLAMEKRTRHPRSPECPEQYAFIEQWKKFPVASLDSDVARLYRLG